MGKQSAWLHLLKLQPKTHYWSTDRELKLAQPYSRIVHEKVLLCSHVSSSEENPPIAITT